MLLRSAGKLTVKFRPVSQLLHVRPKIDVSVLVVVTSYMTTQIITVQCYCSIHHGTRSRSEIPVMSMTSLSVNK